MACQPTSIQKHEPSAPAYQASGALLPCVDQRHGFTATTACGHMELNSSKHTERRSQSSLVALFPTPLLHMQCPAVGRTHTRQASAKPCCIPLSRLAQDRGAGRRAASTAADGLSSALWISRCCLPCCCPSICPPPTPVLAPPLQQLLPFSHPAHPTPPHPNPTGKQPPHQGQLVL
jgi:hypothetical protein